jgi:tetratricopeptide (TPR) repeat protein
MEFHRLARSILVLCLVLLLAPSPGSAQERSDAFARGLEHFKRERYDEARREFTNAASAQPASAEAHFYLGLTSSRLEDYASAVAEIERAIALDPEFPGGHVSLGIAQYNQGEYAAAAKALEQELASDPESGPSHFFLGLSYQKLARYDESIASFERAARHDPSFEQLALYNIGLSNLEMRQFQQARESLDRAVAADPNSESASSARTLLRVVDAEEKNEKRFALSGRIGLMVEDNVTVPELDASSGEADVAGVFEVAGAFRILEAPSHELEVGYDFYQSVYADVTDANLQSHTFSIDGSRAVHGLDTGLSYRFTHASLGGDDFLDLHDLLPSVGYSVLSNWYVILGYNYQHKDFDVDNDRDADHHALALDNFWFLCDGKASLSLGYRLQKEDTDGPEFEYLGNLVKVRLNSAVAIGGFEFDTTAFFQYQSKEYDNVTASIGEKRADDLYTAGLGFGKSLNRIIRARLDYGYFNSDSNLPDSDYDEHTITLSLGFEY